MSRPRFLADEDLRGSIVHALRRRAPSVEVTRVLEHGLTSADDDDVLDFAWLHRWLVVSHDVNTMKADAELRIGDGREIHGLFLVSQRRPISAVVECLILISEASEFEEWRNKIVFLPF